MVSTWYVYGKYGQCTASVRADTESDGVSKGEVCYLKELKLKTLPAPYGALTNKRLNKELVSAIQRH